VTIVTCPHCKGRLPPIARADDQKSYDNPPRGEWLECGLCGHLWAFRGKVERTAGQRAEAAKGETDEF